MPKPAPTTDLAPIEAKLAAIMSLEKAGTPAVDKINATFADLVPGAKGWLDTYRGRITR